MSRRWMRLSVARARLGGAGMRQRGAGVRVCVCVDVSQASPRSHVLLMERSGVRGWRIIIIWGRETRWRGGSDPPRCLSPPPPCLFWQYVPTANPCVLCICLCEFRECVWGGLRLVVSNRPFFGVCVYVHQKL